MSFTEVLFIICFSVLFFCYLGYGILVFLVNRLRSVFIRNRTPREPEHWLPVTVIIAAYNERAWLDEKISNTLQLDYPAGLLDIIVVADGSAESPKELVERYPGVTLLYEPERKGKLAAIKRAMRFVRSPVVVFSDANTELNRDSVRNIARHYGDSRVGGVAGEKRIITGPRPTAVGEAEGLYWKYESFMKKQDAEFNTVVGAAGELFSIRTDLFSEIDDRMILDDFVISMKVCLKGYKIAYEPGAFATELPSSSLSEEEKRKVRISAGAYQCIKPLGAALNLFRYPLLGFQYISRRLLRWVVCPVLLPLLAVTNALLYFRDDSPFIFTISFWCQALFYGAAAAGWLITLSGKRPGIFTVPFYFTFMNYCLVKGFFRYVAGRHSVLWDRAVRQGP